MIRVFSSPASDKREFDRILGPFRTITRNSRRISESLGTSQLFLRALGRWLKEPLAPAIRLDLLRMTNELFNNLSSKHRFVQMILPVVDGLANSELSQRLVIKQCFNLIGLFVVHADRATWRKLDPETQRKYGVNFEADADPNAHSKTSAGSEPSSPIATE